MKPIPTAREFLETTEDYVELDDGRERRYNDYQTSLNMIAFTKLHVKAALKAKVDAMKDKYQSDYCIDELDCFTDDAYPLTNIK